MPDTDDFASLSYLPVTFHLKAFERIHLADFSGATLRGAIGYALKSVVCPFHERNCTTCLLHDTCHYIAIFETPVPEDSPIMRKYTNAPHPFVLHDLPDGEKTLEMGENFSFSMTLLGKAATLLPYFFYAVERLGEKGLGKGRGRFILEEISSSRRVLFRRKDRPLNQPPLKTITLPAGPPPSRMGKPSTIAIKLITPLRIRSEGRLVQRLTFPLLFRNAIRRLGLLNAFYGDGAMQSFPFKMWIEAAEKVDVTADKTTWRDQSRYSTRQKQRMSMGGLVGRINFTGPLGSFRPYLKAVEIVHVGRNTSFGLGRIKVEKAVERVKLA